MLETPSLKARFYNSIGILGLFVVVNSLYLIATRHNNLQSADSTCYIIIAENFHEIGEYISCDGKPLVVWPPLFPTVLSWGMERFDVYVKLLNMVCLNALLGLWILIGSKVFQDQKFNRAFIIFLSVSTPMMLISTFIWTELIFLILLSVYLYIIYLYLERRRDIFLWLAMVVSVLMLMQRNVGVFLLTAITIALFLFANLSARERIKIIIQYLIPISGSMVWNIERFWIRSNISIYEELFPAFTIGRNVRLVLGELGRNLAPGALEAIGIALASGVVIGAIFILLNRREKQFMRIVSFLFLFYVFFWFLVPGDTYEMARFLSIIVPLFYLLIFYGLDFMVNLFSDRYRMAVAIGLILWGAYSILRLLYNVAFWGRIDIEFLSRLSEI